MNQIQTEDFMSFIQKSSYMSKLANTRDVRV